MKNDIHVSLTGKGGVGKTTTMGYLANYMRDRLQVNPVCLDTDPVNKSLAAYGGLEAKKFDLLVATSEDEEDYGEERVEGIDPQKFVELFEFVRTAPEDRPIIIDTGATSFIQFSQFLLDYDIFNAVKEETGRNIRIHAVVVGGAAMQHTCQGLVSLCEAFGESGPVVWLNDFLGALKQDGVVLEDMAFWEEVKDDLGGVVRLPRLAPSDKTLLGGMASQQMLFAEYLADKNQAMANRSRMRLLQRKIYDSIEMGDFL